MHINVIIINMAVKIQNILCCKLSVCAMLTQVWAMSHLLHTEIVLLFVAVAAQSADDVACSAKSSLYMHSEESSLWRKEKEKH